MTLKTRTVMWCFVLLLLAIGAPLGADDQKLKPFNLGYRGPGTIDAKLSEIKEAVQKEGFQVVGEYAPYQGAHVVVITSETLKNNAAQSKFGAYGAIQRISLTEAGNELQVAYTNPLYTAQAYRMTDALADTSARLEKALGKTAAFGSEDGITAKKLRKYHYMIFMPYFTDQTKLASYDSYEEAVEAVESNLATGEGGTVKVYRVDLPGKKESVFGVGLKEGDGSDESVMKVVDFGELKQTPHLPYELIISEETVYALHGKFRIAISFPDLSMGTFMKISSAPSAIEDTLKMVAGGR